MDKNQNIPITVAQVIKIHSKQAHTVKNSRTVNTHALMAVKIHQKSPKIMKSLPSIQNMLNYTFASIGSKTEGKL